MSVRRRLSPSVLARRVAGTIPPGTRVSTYSRVGEGLWTTWEQMVEQFAAHHNICTAKSAAQRCPVQECVILVVALPTLMNGRRNEELIFDGRRADSDHHVVTDGVLLDVQPRTVDFIPRADLD